MTSKSECNQPISTAMPSAVELRNNKELEAYLTRNCNIFETDEGQFKRSGVIDKINQILQAWAIEVGTSKNIASERLVNGGGIHLRIFGSTRLNVHNGDSDIDTLCLAPSYITKGDFFSTFVEKLQSRHDVETLTAIGEAYTPVIKFTIDNQSVDMVFASIAAKDVDGNLQNISPSFDILDLKCLKGLDDASVRSINGARVAEKICNLVPNMDNYCSTLRIIKYWARQRGLYSNVLGFLGGVNYAILVAFICQLYSNACTYTLVNKFFNVLTMWRWPAPILICAFEDVKLTDSSGRYLPVWNPKVNYKDALHLMPIITPAYPAMNSAYNVASPQFRCIQEEILRGNLLFQNHSTTNGAVFNWNRFFEPCTKEFFSKYPRYIQVDISATSVADHRSWFGWVESRFRTLIISLEQPPVIFSHPMANCFHRHPGNTGSNSNVTTSTSMSRINSISNIADFPAIGETVVATAENNSNSGNSDTTGGGLSVIHPNNIDNISSPLMSRQNSSESDIDLFKTMQLHSGTKPAVPMSYKSILAGNSPKSAKTVPSPSAAAPAASGVYHYTMTTPERGSGGNSGLSSNQTDGVAGGATGAAEGDETGLYISSFFVGLSFQQGVNFADVTPAIADFTSRVNNWMLKKPNMECNISSFNYENVPSFVFETTAEPSSVKSCTPKVNRTRPPAVPANGYVGANEKGNDDGEEDYLHSRLIRSSVVETGVKKSQTPKNNINNVTNSSNSGNSGNNNNSNNNSTSSNNNTSKAQNKVESLQNTVTFQNDTQPQQNTNNKNSNSMSRKMSIDDVTTVTTTGTAGNAGGNVNFGQGRKMSVEDVYGDDYSSSNSGNYSNIPPTVPLSQAQLVHHNQQQQQQQLMANSRSRGNSTLSNNADNHHPNNSNHAVKVLFANDDSPVRQMTPSAQQQHGMYQHPHMVPQQVTQHQYFLHQQQLLQQQQQLQQQMGGQHHLQPPAGYALSGPAPDHTAHGGNSPPIISKSPSAQQQKQYQQNQFQQQNQQQQLYPVAPHLMTSFPPQLINVNGGGSTSHNTSVNSSTATSPHGNQHGHTQQQKQQHGHGNASLPTPPGLLFPSPLMPPAMYAAHYGSGHLEANMPNMPNIPLQNMQFGPSGGSGGTGAGNVSINNAMNNSNSFNSSAFPYPLPPHLMAPGMPNLQGGMAPQMLHNNVFANNGAAGATGAGGENLSPGGQNRQGGPGANPMIGQQLPPNQMLSFNQFVQHQMMLQQAQLQAQHLQSQQLQAQQAPNAPPGLSTGPDRSEFAEISGPPGQLPIHFGSFPNPANTPSTQQSQHSQPPQQQFPHTAQYFQQHMQQAHPQQSQQPPASCDASGNAASTASAEQHAAPEMQQPHAHIFNSPPKRIKKETHDNHATASNQSSGGNSNARQNQQQHTSTNANNKTNNNSSNNSNKSNQRARGETR